MKDLPARPRLADHVLARRHVIGDEQRVVLFDLRTGRLAQMGPREWGLIACADGTRDVDGILLAASREGANAPADSLRAFLAQLAEVDMLADGIGDPAPAVEAIAAPPIGAPNVDDAAARPLSILPDFSLHCDGSGSCCRIYVSVIFGPIEAARARALLPLVLDGGVRHERVFLPERGSAPTGGAAVALRDGRCAYLGDSGLCGLHAAGGPSAKPIGCNTFPSTFVDDGESLRVSVSVECSCVLASVGRAGGSAIVAKNTAIRADLSEAIVVDTLPARVPIGVSTDAPRAEAVAWSRKLEALPAPADVASALFHLGEAMDREELAAARWILDPLDPESIEPWIQMLHRRAAKREHEDSAWRAERDLARLATRWITAACASLLAPGGIAALLAAPIAAPADEAFYLRAALHGHRLFGELPLSLALRDRAVRVLVAREIGRIVADLPENEADPAAAHPLALVEAMLRGHGFDAYVYDLRG